MSSHKQQVRWVDGTRQDTNAHFPIPRFWERTLLNRQHLCRLTILSEANRFHLSTLLSSAREYLSEPISLCNSCKERFQLLLHHLRNLGDFLALVLGKQGDKVVVGHEGLARLILVHDEVQGSI